MTAGRPRSYSIQLNDNERAQLESFARSRSLPHALARRAKIVLRVADGMSNSDVCAKLDVSHPTVANWCRRYCADGIEGLYDLPPGYRCRTYNDDDIARLLSTALEQRPRDATHWTVRDLADETNISKSTVHRYLKLFGVQPHRTRGFTLSTDPFFVEKVRDIVGLYLNPPDNALVLCVDEKTQIQALERCQPILPMGLGYVEGVTHDYFRHGTTTLFAALNILEGTVIGQNMARHRHQEFIRFLNQIERDIPAGKIIHVILDDYAAHKHAKVQAWLVRHPRWTFHFTPTSSSWLNAVEGFFAKLSKRRLKRGVFRSIVDLPAAINRFLNETNDDPKPFTWTADPDKIIAAVKRGHQVLDSTH